MKLDPTRLPVTIKQARRARMLSYFLILALAASAIVLGGWLAVVLGALALLILVAIEIKRQINAIIVDRDKVTLSTGLITVHTTSVYYREITDIKISQNPWERMLNYGKIYVNTPGHGEYELVEAKIPSPHELRNFIEALKHGKWGEGVLTPAQPKSKRAS